MLARFRTTAAAHERQPGAVLLLFQKKNFRPPTRAGFTGEEAGWNDLGIVDHHQVARPQVGGEVQKMAVFDPLFATMHDHHTGAIPAIRRVLGDQLRRQFIVKRRRFESRLVWHHH